MRRATAAVVLLVTAVASPVMAQQPRTMSDVLSFLLTNQSVQTGDFTLDQAAALATRDTISRALLVDVATMPLGSSSGGFSYQFNPTLGTLQRRSSTFGPFFVDRVLGAGRNRVSVGLSAQYGRFDSLDGNNLRNGAFVTTANQFNDERTPFDTDSLTLQAQVSTLTASVRYGVTNRLDIGGIVPLISLSINGTRVNTYRGTSVVQASASATRIGIGDVGIQTKYQLTGDGASGLALGADIRLPTGNSDDLLGTGKSSLGLNAIGSIERGPFALHLNGGYSWGGISNEVRAGAAAAIAATPHLTIGGEIFGRRIMNVGRIVPVAFANPFLAGVETFRLLPVGSPMTPVLAATGIKWNVADTWVLDAHIMVPVTHNGLTARVTPTIALERTFGR